MRVIRDLKTMDAQAAGCVLVPTMGALHAGHRTLIERGVGEARALGVECLVSIFVNPTQFNQRSDFERYPRTEEADLAMCAAAGAGGTFVPDVETVYPIGAAAPVPALPPVATEPGLEDSFRPGHFAGVCQVVLRLFALTRPAAAVFGEKDWQQLQVVSAMTREQGLPIRIVPHPTQRDPDGLAMSSRNRFLSDAERRAALAIPRAINAAGMAEDARRAEDAMARVLADSALKVEYAVVREAAMLVGEPGKGSGRALIAAWSGGTRLIDNGPWPRA